MRDELESEQKSETTKQRESNKQCDERLGEINTVITESTNKRASDQK